jgi:hypothetical protein
MHTYTHPHSHTPTPTHTHTHTHMQKMELTENSNFRLFAANGKRKHQTSVFAPNGNGKRKFVFLSQQRINGNQQLLLERTCPSMVI